MLCIFSHSAKLWRCSAIKNVTNSLVFKGNILNSCSSDMNCLIYEKGFVFLEKSVIAGHSLQDAIQAQASRSWWQVFSSDTWQAFSHLTGIFKAHMTGIFTHDRHFQVIGKGCWQLGFILLLLLLLNPVLALSSDGEFHYPCSFISISNMFSSKCLIFLSTSCWLPLNFLSLSLS